MGANGERTWCLPNIPHCDLMGLIIPRPIRSTRSPSNGALPLKKGPSSHVLLPDPTPNPHPLPPSTPLHPSPPALVLKFNICINHKHMWPKVHSHSDVVSDGGRCFEGDRRGGTEGREGGRGPIRAPGISMNLTLPTPQRSNPTISNATCTNTAIYSMVEVQRKSIIFNSFLL